MAAKQKQDHFVRNALIIGVGGWLFIKNIVPMFMLGKPTMHTSGDTSGNNMLIPPAYQTEEYIVPNYPGSYPLEDDNTADEGDPYNDTGKMKITPKPELKPLPIFPPAPLPIKPPPPAPTPIVKKVADVSASLKGIFMDMIDQLDLGDATWYYSSQDMIDIERPIKQRQKHESSCCNFIHDRKQPSPTPMHKIFY